MKEGTVIFRIYEVKIDFLPNNPSAEHSSFFLISVNNFISAIGSFLFLSHALEHIPGGTGTAMLFSAGTFLYVATVHVLPEVGPLDKKKLILMVVGCIAPLILSLGHSH